MDVPIKLLSFWGKDPEQAHMGVMVNTVFCIRDNLQKGDLNARLHQQQTKNGSLLKKNQVLERQEALLKIGGEDSYYITRSMDVFMTHIRKILKDEPGVQIMNLRGVVFKLMC